MNERKEINALLSGAEINKSRIFRSCYLLGKHFKQTGFNEVKAREEIRKWAKLHKLSLPADLNMIISKVFSDNMPVVEKVIVLISKSDIDEINRRFDRPKTKLLAFALLCYAKLHADDDGIISVSMQDISCWTGINKADFYRNYGYLKELEDFGYIVRLDDIVPKSTSGNSKPFKKNSRIKICVDYTNRGDYVFSDRNITEEFEELFNKSEDKKTMVI